MGTVSQVRLQPDRFPPLAAKAGATKLVCQGPPVAPGSSPSCPPKRSSPSSPFPNPHLHVLPLAQPQILQSGWEERREPSPPGPGLAPLCPDSGGCHLTHALAKLPSPLPPAPRRCWPPGPWGPSSGSSQKPMQMKSATPCN